MKRVTDEFEMYYLKYQSYPDVLTLEQFREMLGGIADDTARKIVKEDLVVHYKIRNTIYIPKISVIDYITSKHYKTYKKKLRHRID